MTILGSMLAGMGLRRMTSSKKAKQALMKQPYADESDLRGVASSVIGQRSMCNAHRPHLVDYEDDDRWRQIEELEAVAQSVSWRKCVGCAFMCGEYESICLVCGTHNPVQSKDECIIDIAKVVQGSLARSCSDDLSVSTAPTENLTDNDVTSEISDADAQESEDDDSGSEDGEFVAGALDMPPVEGTQVKVLQHDNSWVAAQVLKVGGTKARLCFEDGTTAVIDFQVHAVRLLDYEGQDEDSEISNEEYSEDGESSDGDEDCDDQDDDGIDEDDILGTLDEAPPVGTMVEILCQDDTWQPARVVESDGAKAVIIDTDGDREEVDFVEYAVRLCDYEIGVHERTVYAIPTEMASSLCPVAQSCSLDVISEGELSDSGLEENQVAEAEAAVNDEEVACGEKDTEEPQVAEAAASDEDASQGEGVAPEILSPPCAMVIGNSTALTA
jgi:hypothetical protein